MRLRTIGALCTLTVVGLGGCGGEEATEEAEVVEEVVLGPADGMEMAATDLERVAVGDLAPDFTAMSLAGELVTLSQFRGQKNVVLMFYRGHW